MFVNFSMQNKLKTSLSSKYFKQQLVNFEHRFALFDPPVLARLG